MLSGADFPKDMPQQIAKEIFLHGIVSGKAGATVESIIKILDGLSLPTIQQLESGNILRRLVISLQRASKTPFHFENVIEESAADMAAACVLIFLAGLVAKDKVHPKISLNYWFFFSSADGSDDLRPYAKFSIRVNK